ncbi:MAG: sugar phosphate isomerase/epimerase [Methanomicrobia archaeon]|nr:sugar phosphate isomerase/epimerase [Methanomicrobia archaeon]
MGVLLGAPVWYGNRPFQTTLKELYKLGLDYIEFSLDYPLPDSMPKAEREELKQLVEEFGLKIGFHSPIDTPVAHPRDEIADASMTVLRNCMAFSAVFLPRSLYYNCHLHPRVTTYKLEDVRPQIKQKSLGRCEELTRLASEFGIPICVENELVPFDKSDLIHDALSRFYPHLQFTFDIGHAIKAEARHSKTKTGDGGYLDYLKKWIDKCGQKILVVHVHDCACTGNVVRDHLALGTGDLDLDEVFKLLKATTYKYLLVETFWKNRERKEMDYEELERNVELIKSYF